MRPSHQSGQASTPTITTIAGSSRRYGGARARTASPKVRLRRREEVGVPISAAGAAARGAALIARRSPGVASPCVEDLGDLRARARGRRSDRTASGEDLREHVLQHLGVLDVHPVRRRGHEPARRRRAGEGSEGRLAGVDVDERGRVGDRSEEHTSELQSQSNLVCRLLLEKKKKKTNAAL